MSAAVPQTSRIDQLRAKSWLKWAIAVTASLGALLEVIDVSIVNVALADMQSTLGATLSEIGWVVTAYAMANVIIIPLSAWLGDYFGKKRYFIFSMIAFTLASAMCGMATSLPMLVLARAIQGLAGGGLLAKAQSILFETFPPEEHGIAQAVFGIGVIAGPAIGPTLGGYLVTNFSWPWIFYVNLPVGILAVAMSYIFLPEDSKIRQISSKVDWAGIGLLAVGLGSFQWMLEKGHDEDWFESRLIVTLAIVVVVSLTAFIWRELRIPNPAVNLRVLKYRSLAAGSALSTILGLGLYGALFAVPIYAQTVLHMTAMQTGFLLLPGALASAVMMPIIGKFLSGFDARFVLASGGMVTMGVMFALSGINVQMGQEDFLWPMIFRGVGVTLMFLPLTLATLGPIPRKDIAAASGFYNLTRQLGGSIGIAILTTFLAQRESFHLQRLSDHISIYSAATQERLSMLTNAFIAKGSDPTTAGQQALAALNGTVQVQSAVLSFADMFRFVGMAFLLGLPLVFLLGKGRKNGNDGGDAH